MANTIVIYKKQALNILSYDLKIFPPIIPKNYILFSYNRLVNFENSNIIREISGCYKIKWCAEDLFELLLKRLNCLCVEYIVKEDIAEIDMPTLEFRKINTSIIKKCMNCVPLWAINDKNITTIPHKYLLNQTDYKTPEEYVKNLVKVSYAIRNFLNLNG